MTTEVVTTEGTEDTEFQTCSGKRVFRRVLCVLCGD
jgi:hypothetical protein